MCAAWGRFTATEGARRRNAHPSPGRCRGGCTRGSLAVGDDDLYYRWESQFHRCLLAGLLFLCCGRGWVQTLGGFLPYLLYLPVSVKNVGGLEDGGGTELASEAADVELLGASGRLQAARPGQPAPSSGVTRLLGAEQGSPAQKEAGSAGTRPAPSASTRSPDTGSPGTILVALARLPLAPSTVFLTFLTL